MTERPLRADAKRNRERVLAAAQEIFAEEGLAAPLDHIARRAGVGAGTVYRHFPTKEALFEAAMLDRVERMIARATALRDAEDPGVAFFDFLTQMVDESGVKRDLLDAIGGAHDTAAFGRLGRDVHAAIDVLLTRAQQSGSVRADIDITDLMAMLQGAFYAGQADGVNPERLRRTVAVLFDGLRRT